MHLDTLFPLLSLPHVSWPWSHAHYVRVTDSGSSSQLCTGSQGLLQAPKRTILGTLGPLHDAAGVGGSSGSMLLESNIIDRLNGDQENWIVVVDRVLSALAISTSCPVVPSNLSVAPLCHNVQLLDTSQLSSSIRAVFFSCQSRR